MAPWVNLGRGSVAHGSMCGYGGPQDPMVEPVGSLPAQAEGNESVKRRSMGGHVSQSQDAGMPALGSPRMAEPKVACMGSRCP